MDEFTVRCASYPKNKQYNVFKLHKNDDVTWTEAKMRRENDYQPWQIKFGSGRAARRFKAIKEGGVGDNASYFFFYKSSDKSDTYEVCPVDEWYNVSATQRYKTLTAEEAEQKFEQRYKMLNLFSVMHLKKNGEGGEGGGFGQDTKSFKVSEMDDWDQSDQEGSSGNEDDQDDSKKKMRRKKGVKKEKEDPDDAPDEAKEDSDEGDAEQKEVDYMSDSSSEFSDQEESKDPGEVKGIAEEEALRDLLSTDEEDETENGQQKGTKAANSKANLGITTDIKQDAEDFDSEDSSDSDDYDVDDEKMDSMFLKKGLTPSLAVVKQEIKQEVDTVSATTSGNRQQSNQSKRKLSPEVVAAPPQPAKRPCTAESPSSPANGQERIVEDLIRKYLSRKPMTLKTLLKDIKSKLKRIDGVTPGMDTDLVNIIASIMKRLDIDKQKINDVTYFSLKL